MYNGFFTYFIEFCEICALFGVFCETCALFLCILLAVFEHFLSFLKFY